MRSICSHTSTVHFGETGYQEINGLLAQSNYSSVFVLVDSNTHEHCLAPFLSQLATDLPIEVLEVEPGEVNKTLETCNQLWLALSELGADRKSLLINLGGGVVTDMGGFVAAAFKRGIDFINVPTTLLSMVDASVGGKTGIDLGPLKNQIGTISQPVMVLVDPAYLKTLDQRQKTSGFAEMLKHGLIKDATYWTGLKPGIPEKLIESIHYSVAIKNEVVTQDPTEQGLRKILNFGHTLGHAVESYFLESEAHKTLLHGEAIAVGMVMEAYLSYKLCGLPYSACEEIKTTFKAHFGSIAFEAEDIEKILGYLKFDKKNSHGKVKFALLKAMGNTQWDIEVPQDLLLESITYYEKV